MLFWLFISYVIIAVPIAFYSITRGGSEIINIILNDFPLSTWKYLTTKGERVWAFLLIPSVIFAEIFSILLIGVIYILNFKVR